MAITRRPDTTPTEHAAAAPWLESVEVPSNARMLYLSGQVPPIIDSTAPIDSRAAYGDMEQQTFGVLERLRQKLENAGYGLGDIVKLTGFLVGDPEFDGQPDLEGFGRAYRRFFGTDLQPNLHARTRVQVVKLMNPAWLVEIEAIAARTD